MKKKGYIVAVAFLVIGLIGYLDWYERNTSFSSPI
ncbi:putative membrane-anchored protein [Bacillus mesophilus]|nr:putative membrane-anchored protein [Bacillus mesophilus]